MLAPAVAGPAILCGALALRSVNYLGAVYTQRKFRCPDARKIQSREREGGEGGRTSRQTEKEEMGGKEGKERKSARARAPERKRERAEYRNLQLLLEL
jgi:hypothetical protein